MGEEKDVQKVLEEIKTVTEENLNRARKVLEESGLPAASEELKEAYRYNSCRHVDEKTEKAG